ncbi:MAG: MFS transporter [Deltaproteobacteria bacterium]|nr:MFS transporter [Deltaproteobacteria bacterium]MBW1949719.1 MFS transporter [Deltaproteobacteria bacterium]
MSNNHERADKTPRLFYGWIVVGVSFVTLAFGFGVWYSFSVFFLAVIKDFGWSRAAASSIFSVFVITQATMGLLAGYLQDRFGPRIVIPFGTLILALALALTSRAQSLWYFYVCYGVFAGASMSLLGFGSHSAFLPQWFERKRGLATGIAMSGIGFGMLLIVPLAERSITAYGWRTSYLLLSGSLLLFVAPLNLIFSRRRPADMGLEPDGGGPESGGETTGSPWTMVVVDAQWAGRDWRFQDALRTRRFWCLVGSFFCGAFVYQGTLLHAVSAMVDAGLGRDTGANYFGILGMAGAGGKILFGYLSDVYGRERAGTLAGCIAGAGIVCLIGLSYIPGSAPLLFALLFGLGYGAVAPLFPSVTADIFLGRSFGLIFAMVAIGGGLGGSMGPFLTGLLRDVTGSYTVPFTAFLGGLFFSYLLIWLAGPRKVRKMVKNRRQDKMGPARAEGGHV